MSPPYKVIYIYYSTVYSGGDQRKHQRSASLAFEWGIHRGPVNSPHKWPVTRKMFPFDNVIMISTGDPLHSRALAHNRAPLLTQPCSHCSHSRAPGEQWARLCVFTLHGCVQAARLCRGSPVIRPLSIRQKRNGTSWTTLKTGATTMRWSEQKSFATGLFYTWHWLAYIYADG